MLISMLTSRRKKTGKAKTQVNIRISLVPAKISMDVTIHAHVPSVALPALLLSKPRKKESEKATS
jgi:hypothetical protein